MLATEKTLQQERFRIIQQFGRDNKTTVYQAFDNFHNTNVVLAQVTENSRSVVTPVLQQARKAAFNDRAKILTGISHELLPIVHDYFSEADQHYLVIEPVEGKSLSVLLTENSAPFSLEEVSGWANQMLDALNYLHRYVPPIVHRRVSPHNITLTADGVIKLSALTDAQIFGAKTNVALSVSDSETNLPYLPLEVIWEGLDPASQKVILTGYDERSEKILEQLADARSDIYSLGAAMYYLLTGKIPTDALARSIEILEGNSDPLLPPHEINAEIPHAISEILMRALEIRRENRFDSAIIMRQVLRTALVRVKEYEIEEAKQQEEEAAQKLKAAEQKRLAQEQQLFEQKRLEVEAEQQRLEEERQLARQKESELAAEQQRQADLAAEQFREAENQTRLAQQRAAAAEQLKLETAAKKSDDAVLELDTLAFETSQETVPVNLSSAPESVQHFAVSNRSAESAGELFAVHQESGRGKSKSVMFAGIAAVLCAAIFGIWFFVSSNAAKARQNTESQTMSVSEPLKPTEAANMPATAAKTETETNVLPAVSVSPETPVTAAVSPEIKNKPAILNAAPKPAAPKAVVPPVKTSAAQSAQKKAVTVDDLINDN